MGTANTPNVYERRCVPTKNSSERKMSDYENFQQFNEIRHSEEKEVADITHQTERTAHIQRGP